MEETTSCTVESFSKVRWGRHVLAPLALIVLAPIAVFLFWYTNEMLEGSFGALFQIINTQGFITAIYGIIAPYFFGTPLAWKIIASFAAFELLLMRFLPGKTFYGPITPAGNVPVYKANGVLAFFVTLFAFYLGAYQFQFFAPTIIYDNFGGILGALNFFSLLFCIFLYFKGKHFPSSSDAGTTGNLIFDYYWGSELYPRLFGWDVKMFTNCRFGLMSWALIILSLAAKQQELYGLSNSMAIAVSLQLLYIAKFFAWETGYLCSLDIMHDRAGYYICWACLVFVPAIYTSPTMYLVHHPNELSNGLATFLLLGGILSIFINYWADRQRQIVRAKHGKCTVWGRPPELIVAHYVTEKGEAKQNILLASGWWGISRHFHYIPEILAALFWTLPALFDHFLPYFYVVFLTILLVDRSLRDEERCAAKYGCDWDKYCRKVPYKLIPLIY